MTPNGESAPAATSPLLRVPNCAACSRVLDAALATSHYMQAPLLCTHISPHTRRQADTPTLHLMPLNHM